MSKTIFAVNGKNISLVKPVCSPVAESVPPFVYTIQLDDKGVHLIHLRDKFDVPEKTYGDIEKYASVLIKDYHVAARDKTSTGAVMCGTKAQGNPCSLRRSLTPSSASMYPASW